MMFNIFFLLQICGTVVLVITSVNVARWMWQYLWLPRRLQGPRLAERYGRGSWVLITGASDGLGRSFARELAGYGFNLILISRTQEKLTRLQTELEAAGIEVLTVAADLSDTSGHTYPGIIKAARDVDLSIVINCVGATVHRRYADITPATLNHLLSINVYNTAALTNFTLPLLLHHSTITGRRSAVLNVGSIVGRFYWPGTQLYGACKAFIDHLTIPLAFEYRDQLDVLSFQPTVMDTAMATGTEPAAITIPPQAAAHAALSHLGLCVASHGHWRHAILAVLFTIIPDGLRNRIFLEKAMRMSEVELKNG
jgi:17beta-estradiol 17-dehydrogenase / very-long-chain 3-oxoacyl-CoA reductase